MTAAPDPADERRAGAQSGGGVHGGGEHGGGEHGGGPAEGGGGRDGGPAAPTFDRHMVLDQLGGVRGMVDASLPTLAFIVANSLGGLAVGIWWALGAAVLLFAVRLVRRENVQQAIGGLFGVAVAVGIAAMSGQARDFFVPGIIRNAVIGVALLVSIPFRWPLLGVVAEFFAPSHLGSMAMHGLGGLRERLQAVRHHRPERGEDPEPERHWRDDPRAVRAYSWLTVLWAGTFLLRVGVQWLLYLRDDVALLGTASLVLGLPVSAVALAVTLYVVGRLHRHRVATDGPAARPGGAEPGELPAA